MDVGSIETCPLTTMKQRLLGWKLERAQTLKFLGMINIRHGVLSIRLSPSFLLELTCHVQPDGKKIPCDKSCKE